MMKCAILYMLTMPDLPEREEINLYHCNHVCVVSVRVGRWAICRGYHIEDNASNALITRLLMRVFITQFQLIHLRRLIIAPKALLFRFRSK